MRPYLPYALAGVLSLGLCFDQQPAAYAALKDQSRLGGDKSPQSRNKHTPLPDLTPPELPDLTPPDLTPPDIPDPEMPELNIPDYPVEFADLPPIPSVELTIETAKRALDAYERVGTKYNDQGLADYDSLEKFVASTEAGKKLEAEVKEFGFSDISDWNAAITSVTTAYNTILHDQGEDIRNQIDAVKADKTLSQAKKNRIIASLNALIPSDNNKTVIKALMKDSVYAEKLKLVETFE